MRVPRTPADIDANQHTPAYSQLKTLILNDIAAGHYRPGERLPTEVEFCDMFAISRTPVHRALTELADEGVVVRQRRAGTFVHHLAGVRGPQLANLRVVVTEPHWAAAIRTLVPADMGVDIVEVEFTDLQAVLTRAVAEGTAPDLAVVDEVWTAQFADSGFLHRLDELDPDWIGSDFATDFVSPLVEGRRRDGHVFTIPEEINVAGLWCRRDMLASVGASPPTTWKELFDTAEAIQAKLPHGRHAFALPGGQVAAETTTYCLLAVLASNGISIVDDHVRLDCGATVNALRFLRSFIEQRTMTAEVTDYHWMHIPELLGSGEVALSVGGSYEAARIAESAGIGLGEVSEHFAFVPFPAGPRGKPATIAGAMGYGIFRQSHDPARAMWLLRQIVAPEALAERAAGRPTIPPRHTAIDKVAPSSSFVAMTAELFETAVMRPSLSTYGIVTVQLQAMLEAVLTARLRPAAAAERTAEIIGAITGLEVVHG